MKKKGQKYLICISGKAWKVMPTQVDCINKEEHKLKQTAKQQQQNDEHNTVSIYTEYTYIFTNWHEDVYEPPLYQYLPCWISFFES